MIATGTPLISLRVWLAKRVAKVHVFDVVRDEVDVSVEILINNLRDPISAQRELPMTGHDINTQQLASVDHVLTQRPNAVADPCHRSPPSSSSAPVDLPAAA